MIPKTYYSQIKNILYPEIDKKPIKDFVSINNKKIKIIEEQNRLKKKQQSEKDLNNNSK